MEALQAPPGPGDLSQNFKSGPATDLRVGSVDLLLTLSDVTRAINAPWLRGMVQQDTTTSG
jgi:hypothetical protein